MINDGFPLRNVGFSNAVDNLSLPRHRWYGFKEAFSPNIVDAAIRRNNLKRDSLIFDPFNGSGTVSVAAAMSGNRGRGVEVNPFFAFLAEVKMSDASSREFLKYVPAVESAIIEGKVSDLERYSTFSPEGGKDKYLFNRSVIRAFEGGWQSTENVPVNIRGLIQLALINSVMSNCNAYKDGKCLRYYRDWRERKYDNTSFQESFKKIVEMIQQDLQFSPIDKERSSIVNQDSRSFLEDNNDIQFDICVTSPPYLNSFDYTDVYRPELFLGRFVNSGAELKELRYRTLRSHVQVKHIIDRKEDFGTIYDDVIHKITDRKDYLWSPDLIDMITAYFSDMKHILTGLRKNAKKGANTWIIVSTSAYAGVEIPVDLILAHIASSCGWRLKEVGVLRNLRTSGQNWNRWSADTNNNKPKLRESAVILQAD